ncbi:MAG TPA: hypothetical protein VKZ99_00360 [Gammaproteobacteria bacterium]|nr:hypothetical protein [Gammaproteobacteria bacterium]
MAKDRNENRLSLKERIEAVEKRLTFDTAHLFEDARALKARAKRRAVSPSALMAAGSAGFIAAEILHARRLRGRGSKPGGRKSSFSLGKVLQPLASIAQAAGLAFIKREVEGGDRHEIEAEWPAGTDARDRLV